VDFYLVSKEENASDHLLYYETKRQLY